MIMCTPKFDNNVQLKEWKKLSGYYCFLQGKNDTVAIGSLENEFYQDYNDVLLLLKFLLIKKKCVKRADKSEECLISLQCVYVERDINSKMQYQFAIWRDTKNFSVSFYLSYENDLTNLFLIHNTVVNFEIY